MGVAATWYLPGVLDPDVERRVCLYVLGGILTFMWLAYSVYLTRFQHELSYVCEADAAIFRLKGSREQVAKQLVSFAELAGIRAVETERYRGGMYLGTSYDYQLFDASGTRVLRLKGSYDRSKGALIPITYQTALATEMAWSSFVLSRLDQILAQQGWVQFDLAAGKWVRVGRGFIEFHLDRSGQAMRVKASEIRKLDLAAGRFSIHHRRQTRRLLRSGRHQGL